MTRLADGCPSASLAFVKLLRVWLLVTLAVLLPIRAAMAVALPCALSGLDSHSEAMYQDAAGHRHSMGVQEADQHDEGAGALHEHEESCLDKCNLCSASCSATPLVSIIAGIPEPLDSVSASFPDLSVPALSFLSDGQERPPRSI